MCRELLERESQEEGAPSPTAPRPEGPVQPPRPESTLSGGWNIRSVRPTAIQVQGGWAKRCSTRNSGEVHGNHSVPSQAPFSSSRPSSDSAVHRAAPKRAVHYSSSRTWPPPTRQGEQAAGQEPRIVNDFSRQILIAILCSYNRAGCDLNHSGMWNSSHCQTFGLSA